MNKITEKMQKVVNVHKIAFFILLLVSSSVFSQKILEGRFIDNSNWYQFYDNGIFDYADVGELGIGRYGKGHYTLTKDSLTLNYDLTNVKYAGYHILKPYLNLKDTIQIDVIVYDVDKNILPNTQVFIPKGIWAEALTDNKGKAQLKVRSKDAFNDLLIINNDVNAMYSIDNISLSLCYEIEVFLTKNFYENMGIKNTIQKYKIIKQKKDYLEVKDTEGKTLKFKKVEKGYYADDPFE